MGTDNVMKSLDAEKRYTEPDDYAPKISKTQIPMDDSLSEENSRLRDENARPRKILDYADGKFKAVVMFGADQDSVVNFLSQNFKLWKVEKGHVGRTQIENDINEVRSKIIRHGSCDTSQQVPGVGAIGLRTQDGLKMTEFLRQWLDQDDHLQFPDDILS